MRLKDEQGMMAIGVALMLIVVLSLFGGALWQYSMAELKRVDRTDQDLQALFLARAGAEMVMGAWQQESNSDQRPYGQLDTIYFDSKKNLFTTTQPEDYLGAIDVEVRRESATEEEDPAEVTVIEATATVGTTSRTVRLVTYPHRYGHDLGWYNENTGESPDPRYGMPNPTQEPIVMRADSSRAIYLGPTVLSSAEASPNRSIRFSASDLVFESPLELIKGASAVRGSTQGDYHVVLDAQRIFLSGFEIAFLPRREFRNSTGRERNYFIKLALPEFDGTKLGELGSSIGEKVVGVHATNIKDDKLYGEIHFGNSPMSYSLYRWTTHWLDFLEFFPDIEYIETTSLPLASYYFQDGYCLDGRDIKEYFDRPENRGKKAEVVIAQYFEQAAKDGWLLPMKPEYQVDGEDLKGLQPFFWEK